MGRPPQIKNPVALNHCLQYGHNLVQYETLKLCSKCGMTLEEIRTSRLPKQQLKEIVANASL